MLRLSSVCVRTLTRRSERSSQPSVAASAFQTPNTAALPVFTPEMASKVAMACRRSSSLAALRPQYAPIIPTAAVSPRPSPQHSPCPSPRSNSASLKGVLGASRSATASPIGIPHARVIVPFMPTRFVSGRASDPQQRSATRVRETAAPGQRPISPPSIVQQSYPLSGQQGTPSQISGHGDTAAQRVIGNAGLSDFLGKVYSTTGASVAVSLIGSYGLALALPPAAFTGAMIGGLVVSLGSLFALMRNKPQTVRRAGSDKLETVNSTGRLVAYGTFIGGNSLLLTPLVVMCSALHPLIIPASAGIAGLVMLGSSLYAYRRPSGSLLAFQGPLTAALGVAVLLNIGALATSYFIGPNLFSSMMYTWYPYFSIGLFSALTAVDTQSAIAEYEKGEADHLMHAVGFYLNFVNLLSSIARIISDLLKE